MVDEKITVYLRQLMTISKLHVHYQIKKQ